MIYYHKKYLGLAKKKKEAIKKTEEEVIHGINHQFSNPTNSEDVLVTTVDLVHNRIEPAKEDLNTGSIPQFITEEEAQLENDPQGKLRSNSMQNARPRKFFGGTSTQAVDPRLAGEEQMKSFKKISKKKKKFMLDFRKKYNENGELINNTILLKNIYKQQPQANRASFFKPTLKIKKNPQLKIIEAYFVIPSKILV